MEDVIRYLDGIVEPTIEEFKNNPTSVRHAFLACVTVFHTIDYMAYPRKSRGLRQKLGNKSPEFALVDKVAHAFKHVVAGNPKGPDRLEATDVISPPPAILGEMILDLSFLDDFVGGVTLRNDGTVELLDVLTRATAFLRKQTEGVQT
jgi:hypothetical protein